MTWIVLNCDVIICNLISCAQTTYWYAKERKTELQDKLDVPGEKKTEFWNVKSKLNLHDINSEFQEDKKLNLFLIILWLKQTIIQNTLCLCMHVTWIHRNRLIWPVHIDGTVTGAAYSTGMQMEANS